MTFRPSRLANVIGNNKIKNSLKILVDAHKKTGERVPHIILNGPSGCGKTTMAEALGNEIGSKTIKINGAAVKDNANFIKPIKSAENNDILFIDEVHCLNNDQQTILYTALEDKILSIGNKYRTVNIPINDFTFVVATTHAGKLNDAFLNRFPINLIVQPYEEKDIEEIISQSSKQYNIKFPKSSIEAIAKRSKLIPRIANSRLDWVAKCCISNNASTCSDEIIEKAFSLLGIDKDGLDENDQKYMSVLRDSFGPLGLKSISNTIGIPESTIINHIEPYLLQTGKIKKISSGRILTESYEDLLS